MTTPNFIMNMICQRKLNKHSIAHDLGFFNLNLGGLFSGFVLRWGAGG